MSRYQVIRRGRHPGTQKVLEGGEILELSDAHAQQLMDRGHVRPYQPPQPAPPTPHPGAGQVRVDRQATHRTVKRTRLKRADGSRCVLEPGDLVELDDAEAKRCGESVEALPKRTPARADKPEPQPDPKPEAEAKPAKTEDVETPATPKSETDGVTPEAKGEPTQRQKRGGKKRR